MEKWQKDFLELVEVAADEVERFFLGVTTTLEALFELSGEFSEHLHNTIVTEVEQYLTDLNDDLDFDPYWHLDEIVDDSELSFPYSVEPSPQQHPACIGCQHYHGQVYGGNLMVCAMHPYGWDDSNCPDWEAEKFEF
jgi:hypothetical protein